MLRTGTRYGAPGTVSAFIDRVNAGNLGGMTVLLDEHHEIRTHIHRGAIQGRPAALAAWAGHVRRARRFRIEATAGVTTASTVTMVRRTPVGPSGVLACGPRPPPPDDELMTVGDVGGVLWTAVVRREQLSEWWVLPLHHAAGHCGEIRVVKQLHEHLAGAEPQNVLRLAQALVAIDSHDARMLSYRLLGVGWGRAAGLRTSQVEALGRGIDDDALSDAFCRGVAGPAWREGRLSDGAVTRWVRSPDPYFRRNALVATIALNAPEWGGSGDPDRTLAVCDMLLDDPEDTVQEALSWALRELAAVDRNALWRFLAQRSDRLAPEVLRSIWSSLGETR